MRAYPTQIPYARVSFGTESSQTSHSSTKHRTWALIMWPLIAHAVITVGIATFMIAYVDQRDFNVELRRPLVRLADGTTVPWVHYAPLQTDITTLLSVMIAVLRLVAACWLGPLCWRCAFILMEEFGLRPTHLHTIISYGITPTPLSGTPRNDKRPLQFLIWGVLLVVLPVHLAAPVLTGSIAWASSNPPPERLSNSTIYALSNIDYDRWNGQMQHPRFLLQLQSWTEDAAYRSFIAWGRDPSNAALKRYSSYFSRLEINNTVSNVTLPYFTVQSIEWIDNPDSTLSSDQLSINNHICPKLNMTGSSCLITTARSVALIPDAPWTNQPSQLPSMVTERRLMVYNSPSTISGSVYECAQGGNYNPNVSGHIEGNDCWKFAWVTYSAGATTCQSCRISSHATLQNDTALEIQEAYLTTEVLRMIPAVINQMLLKNAISEMLPEWNNVDDYIVGMLARSYAGAWMALTDLMNNSRSMVYMNYSVSPRAIRASVSLVRVYIWLGLQSLVTLSGILFLYIQAQSRSPIIGDTTLAAFHLDSNALHEDGAYNRFWGGAARKVEQEGDYLLVKVE